MTIEPNADAEVSEALLAVPARGAALGYQGVASVLVDLQHVVEAVELAENLLGQPVPPEQEKGRAVALRSLWVAAVVSYTSCFSRRNERLHRRDVVALDEGPLPGALEVHDWIDNIRDRHIAHRNSELHQVVVGALPHDVEQDPPGAACVGYLLLDYSRPVDVGFDSLRRLAEALLGLQEQRLKAAQATVFSQLAEMPRADWDGLQTARATAADAAAVTPRKPGRHR